jgi:preprotein translocase subunit Sss1
MPTDKPDPKEYAHLSGLGFQMLGFIALSLLIGTGLDKYLPVAKIPVFTITFAVLGVIGSLVYVIRKVSEKN